MLRNNVIVEEEKDINYSSGSHSTPRSKKSEKLFTDNSQL